MAEEPSLVEIVRTIWAPYVLPRKRDLVKITLWAAAIITAYAAVYWLVLKWFGTFGAW